MYDIFHCTGYTQVAIPRIDYKTQILFFQHREGRGVTREERSEGFILVTQ